MNTRHLRRLFINAALLAALSTMAACATLEETYDSVLGDEQKEAAASQSSSQAATAAPYQDVKAQEESKVPAKEQTLIASISDKDKNSESELKTTALPESTATDSPALANALLTIRFNQPHVQYDNALKDAVTQAEKAKSGVHYDVLSTVPDLTSLPAEQQSKLSARAKNNLHNIVVAMQQAGVSADRIKIADQTMKIRSQEIRIFVK